MLCFMYKVTLSGFCCFGLATEAGLVFCVQYYLLCLSIKKTMCCTVLFPSIQIHIINCDVHIDMTCLIKFNNVVFTP